MDTKSLVEKLVRKFGTRDPFKIAEELGYIVLYTPLVGVRGFYQHLKRCHIIYLDPELDEVTASFVCAHELGHSLLHRGLNRIFMDTRTFLVSSRYEAEADHFAVDLLYDDYDLQDLLAFPVSTAATSMGVSEELAAYRLQSVQPTLCPELWE